MTLPLVLHPDRALPADPDVRDIARRIYRKAADLAMLCMHGHLDAADLADDTPFADPAQLLVVPDHYLTRMLPSQGIALEQLGVPRVDGGPVETDFPGDLAAVLQQLAPVRGTPSRFWLERELTDVFGVPMLVDGYWRGAATVIAGPSGIGKTC